MFKNALSITYCGHLSPVFIIGYKPVNNGLTGISNWTNYKILSLDENTLQLGAIRDKDVDGEREAMLSFNFIAK